MCRQPSCIAPLEPADNAVQIPECYGRSRSIPRTAGIIDNYKHKLMFQVIFELGCRVGEFVRIQVKHINFNRSTVLFPAENTKTKHTRISYLPKGLTNEIKSMLKQKGLMNKRGDKVRRLCPNRS